MSKTEALQAGTELAERQFRGHDGDGEAHVSKILIVDDDADVCALLRDSLLKQGHTADACGALKDASERIASDDYDVVVTDLQLAGESGLELCEWMKQNRADVPVIVITGFGNMDTAVSAIRAGAYDFITKPVDLNLLEFTVRRAAQHRDLHAEVRRLRLASSHHLGIEGMIGESSPIKKLAGLILRVANSDATVLISGESGTGKELIAHALHKTSERAAGPFVAVNCAALPSELLESELFGHERGAFTDARRAREGLLREASGGTLFLDEIGEMSLDMQVKLLRALQERKVRPVGGSQEVAFTARLVAATNKDLESEVEEGRFRADLYYRINVVRLHAPPLRARGNDVLLLAQHFVASIAKRSAHPIKGFSSEAAKRLLDYDWPGNVRELENTVERAMALAQFDEIGLEDLPEKVQSYQSTQLVIGGGNPEDLLTLEELEKRYILKVLATVSGNKTQAAKVLELDRRTLYRKLDRYERLNSLD
ncbi:MAG: sigma-54 dependent transcriptional regulator [Polyangiaceae bacterium]|nr:sigma-54 dependent transcriptional regulator [Polyangiaceae bacterium]